MGFITEPQRQTPITERCSVAVVGGGIAGIAAALSAARAGADTLLIERQFALGGLATLGLISTYLPICDGMGRQVSFGIAEELLRLSVSLDENKPEVLSQSWHGRAYEKQARFRCRFNPVIFATLCERLLRENGVRIIYGAQLCGAETSEGKIKSLFVESIGGRSAICAESFVDASGDAVLCALAGERTALYNRKNILAAWYYSSEAEDGFVRHALGAADLPEGSAEKIETLNEKHYTALDYREQTEFMEDSHEAVLQDFLKGGKAAVGHQLALAATIPQVRMTRRIAAKTELGEALAEGRSEDSIGMISNWRRSGPVYELPFSCLHGEEMRNLITAGRCIGADDAMWDLTRVIPACAVTGEAAGLAAAKTDDFAGFDVKLLQNALRERGIPLHRDEI